MKRIINKIVLLLAFVFVLVSLFIPKANAKTNDLDRINTYIVTVDPNFDDGSLNIQVNITWTVLDSTSEGPLEWVKIGIPNYHVSNIKALTSNIKNAKYYSDGGSFVRIDFKEKYYKGDVIDFSFSFNQSYMYKIDSKNENLITYNYNPGYFNEINVENAVLRWNSKNVKFLYSTAFKLDGDYYTYEATLSHGQYISISLGYDRASFNTIDANKQFSKDSEKYPWLMPLVLISVMVFIVAFVLILAKLSRDPYKSERGFYGPRYYTNFPYWFFWSSTHSRRYYSGGVSKTGKPINPPSSVGGVHGGHSGGGCACACACAGGGRAGCSMKDFYHTNLKTEDVKEVLNNK